MKMNIHKMVIIVLMISFISCKKQDVKDHSDHVEMNMDLKNELETILIKDQGIRELVNGNVSDERKAELLVQMQINESDIEGIKRFELMQQIDSINLAKIEKIIAEYGYPGKSLVGEPANKAALYVIQHSKQIGTYLPLIRKASAAGDIAQTSLAMMEDRNLMEQGQEQIYGTQIKGKANKQGAWIYFLWPVKNTDSVNLRRKEVGFDQSLEEYLKSIDVEFQLYTLNEVNEL